MKVTISHLKENKTTKDKNIKPYDSITLTQSYFVPDHDLFLRHLLYINKQSITFFVTGKQNVCWIIVLMDGVNEEWQLNKKQMSSDLCYHTNLPFELKIINRNNWIWKLKVEKWDKRMHIISKFRKSGQSNVKINSLLRRLLVSSGPYNWFIY